jgi:amino acid permease
MSIHCLFGVLGFGESEFVLSAVKVIAIIVFILAGMAIDIGAFGDPLLYQREVREDRLLPSL